jgi:hypothetical protein
MNNNCRMMTPNWMDVGRIRVSNRIYDRPGVKKLSPKTKQQVPLLAPGMITPSRQPGGKNGLPNISHVSRDKRRLNRERVLGPLGDAPPLRTRISRGSRQREFGRGEVRDCKGWLVPGRVPTVTRPTNSHPGLETWRLRLSPNLRRGIR